MALYLPPWRKKGKRIPDLPSCWARSPPPPNPFTTLTRCVLVSIKGVLSLPRPGTTELLGPHGAKGPPLLTALMLTSRDLPKVHICVIPSTVPPKFPPCWRCQCSKPQIENPCYSVGFLCNRGIHVSPLGYYLRAPSLFGNSTTHLGKMCKYCVSSTLHKKCAMREHDQHIFNVLIYSQAKHCHEPQPSSQSLRSKFTPYHTAMDSTSSFPHCVLQLSLKWAETDCGNDAQFSSPWN